MEEFQHTYTFLPIELQDKSWSFCLTALKFFRRSFFLKQILWLWQLFGLDTNTFAKAYGHEYDLFIFSVVSAESFPT